jgi:phospholipid/cholesterol/gamma-HCH transport system substrate-binding protein
MRAAIGKYWQAAAAMLGLALAALVVGGYILAHERFTLPSWVPLLGSDFVALKAEMTTAQSVTPGQGQEVTIAGVPVGEISHVSLHDGRAVLTLKIRRKYFKVYRDASALLRPKTGLNDMLLELTPGHRAAGQVPEGWTIPLAQTLPNVNTDEVLAALDGDTRDYLRLLLGAAGQGLHGQGAQLSADLRRFDPTARDLLRITNALSLRHANLARAIDSFRALSQALAGKDRQLSGLVDSSNAVFADLARQDANLRAALGLLPSTLTTTRTALGQADRLARTLGPALRRLEPAARALGPSLRAARPFLVDTTPVITNQLRPFARAALPTVTELRPAAADLVKVVPNLTKTFGVVNYLLNTLAFNPPGGSNRSFLFWTAWASHIGASLFSTQDAHGPVRRGLFLVSCPGLNFLKQISQGNPELGTIIQLLNPPSQSQVCGGPGPAGGRSSSGSGG